MSRQCRETSFGSLEVGHKDGRMLSSLRWNAVTTFGRKMVLSIIQLGLCKIWRQALYRKGPPIQKHIWQNDLTRISIGINLMGSKGARQRGQIQGLKEASGAAKKVWYEKHWIKFFTRQCKAKCLWKGIDKVKTCPLKVLRARLWSRPVCRKGESNLRDWTDYAHTR